jgi:hypothetical protein
LTADEEQAIRQYAERKGRCWKQALSDAWMRASEPGLLQSIRNSHGPAWLAGYRLPTSRLPLEHPCGHCGLREGAGAACLCLECNDVADAQGENDDIYDIDKAHRDATMEAWAREMTPAVAGGR